MRCTNCGVGFLNPRPTPIEIGLHYPAAYFSKRKADIPRYERRARYVTDAPGRLLDIGTADRHFLQVMRDRGWGVMGTDPGGSRPEDDDRRLDIRYAPFPEGTRDIEAGSFDVITAWAVIEHQHDPKGVFAEASRLLRPDGLLVQMPNLESNSSRTPLTEDVPGHLHFSNPANLQCFGEGGGLRRENVHHTTDLFGGAVWARSTGPSSRRPVARRTSTSTSCTSARPTASARARSSPRPGPRSRPSSTS